MAPVATPKRTCVVAPLSHRNNEFSSSESSLLSSQVKPLTVFEQHQGARVHTGSHTGTNGTDSSPPPEARPRAGRSGAGVSPRATATSWLFFAAVTLAAVTLAAVTLAAVTFAAVTLGAVTLGGRSLAQSTVAAAGRPGGPSPAPPSGGPGSVPALLASLLFCSSCQHFPGSVPAASRALYLAFVVPLLESLLVSHLVTLLESRLISLFVSPPRVGKDALPPGERAASTSRRPASRGRCGAGDRAAARAAAARFPAAALAVGYSFGARESLLNIKLLQ